MRTAPPRGYLSLSNPLARGMSSAVTFDEQTGSDLYDRVSNQIWRHQAGGTSQWDGSSGGNGYGFLTAASNNWFTYQGSPENFLALTNVSVVVVQKKLDLTNRASAPFGTFGGAGSRCSAHMPYSDGNVYWDFGGTGGANRLSVSSAGLDLRQDNVWVFTAGDHGSEIWFNGHRLASQATPITRSGGVTTYTINAAEGVNGDVAVYSAFYVYQRVLQEAEVKRLAIDPYAPFRPVPLMSTVENNFTGTGTSTLEDVTSDGSGTFTPPNITGTGTSTLGDVTSVGSGIWTPPGVTGSGTSTLEDVTSTGQGFLGVNGSGASTLQDIDSDGNGIFAAPITGAGASTLGNVTSAGVGTIAAAGTIGNVVCDVVAPLNATCLVVQPLTAACDVLQPLVGACRVDTQ